MPDVKYTKVNRVLTIYLKLIQREVIKKSDLAKSFNVSEKTIQRDLDDIRNYLYNNRENEGHNDVVYSHDEKGYFLNGEVDILTKKDILAIVKILLESRAFCNKELEHLVNCLLLQIDSIQRKHVKDIIGNEFLGYVPLKHNSLLLTKIWDLSEIIKNKEVTQITYIKPNGKEVVRKVKPISIIFSEYYFYLIAYFNDFDSPTVFRIDRIKKYEIIGEKFFIPYSDRFKDSEFRKRIQFMYPGKLMKIRFEFVGGILEAVLDRLPTSKIIEQVGDRVIVEAEVYGKGIVMWILSQGSRIKVLSPVNLAEEVKEEVRKMQDLYKKQ